MAAQGLFWFVLRADSSPCLFAPDTGRNGRRKDENGQGFDPTEMWILQQGVQLYHSNVLNCFKCRYINLNLFPYSLLGRTCLLSSKYEYWTIVKAPLDFSPVPVTYNSLYKPLITFVPNWMGKNNHQQHLCNILFNIRAVIEQKTPLLELLKITI